MTTSIDSLPNSLTKSALRSITRSAPQANTSSALDNEQRAIT